MAKPQNIKVVAVTAVSSLGSDWDPITNTDWQKETPSAQCLLRIKRDMMSIYNEPPPGLFVVPDEKDITVIHALITGSFDTPYEGGFFYFLVRCPPDYPIRPPRVKLMTTGGGTVRFNPNLYKNGKICLSILGTWTGPCWSPAQSLASVLISIQSLLNEKPYHNEPGFERERCSGDASRYNDIIHHETLRVAVCGMLENETMLAIPETLMEVMEKTFLEFYDYYEQSIRRKMHLNGHYMQDPFGEERGIFQYQIILARIKALHTKLSEKYASTSSSSIPTLFSTARTACSAGSETATTPGNLSDDDFLLSSPPSPSSTSDDTSSETSVGAEENAKGNDGAGEPNTSSELVMSGDEASAVGVKNSES
ncbi:ubiquitin-conjugating enzyme E2 Z-like [Schistocerca americana]|uniref:ubiquitin-conjugating enzyme E2 Z-like n=1 Tax=Schistocerca americana TaxID=7009 RepID=UPI001F503519|nr:ubiquitin-conjugating enzyme E2 Z-like [Schistocerca americana]XP_049946310.1 ubiquitin-conjugating enzyme E2 Z-like [Schistocerca serialis cubense]